jgi:hypothetical protein
MPEPSWVPEERGMELVWQHYLIPAMIEMGMNYTEAIHVY